jgi:hypothetical protein
MGYIIADYPAEEKLPPAVPYTGVSGKGENPALGLPVPLYSPFLGLDKKISS